MKEHSSFPWDHYSDQPRVMRDKKLKRKIYLRASGQMIKSVLLFPLLPIFICLSFFRKPWTRSKVQRCIGLSVHVETECEGKTIVPLIELAQLVDELDIKHLLVRIPISDSDNFTTYIKHIDSLSKPNREISINLIQDRIILDDPDLLKKNLLTLIPLLKDKITFIHVGNAYNRRKWAFLHFGEYHHFFQFIRKVCNESAPEIKLTGGSVIDFEIPPFLESLFHFRKGSYDGYHAQLYVDRRGAPENTQGGFNLLSKINLIDTMRKVSWKVSGPLWITEINWPLKDSGKFAPCTGSALVDPQTQADYLVRAYLVAIASGKVRTCYWHQLIAPGYGLVDNRGKAFVKYPSYNAFKTLNRLFSNAQILSFDHHYLGIRNLYRIKASAKINSNVNTIAAYWSNDGEQLIANPSKICEWINQNGDQVSFSKSSKIAISSSVLYAISTH